MLALLGFGEDFLPTEGALRMTIRQFDIGGIRGDRRRLRYGV